MFAITPKFNVHLCQLEQRASELCSELVSWSFCGKRLKVRRLQGFLHFVRWYNNQTVEDKLKYAPELKRRIIRQRDSLIRHIGIQNVQQLQDKLMKMLQVMNEVDGGRDVPLTPALSCIPSHRR